MTPEILAVIGFLIVLALSANAYFIKSLVESIEQVKLQTATLLERSLDFDRRITDNKDEIEKLRVRQHTLGNDMHNKLMKLELKIVESSKK
jgi:hypothetical protein